MLSSSLDSEQTNARTVKQTLIKFSGWASCALSSVAALATVSLASPRSRSNITTITLTIHICAPAGMQPSLDLAAPAHLTLLVLSKAATGAALWSLLLLHLVSVAHGLVAKPSTLNQLPISIQVPVRWTLVPWLCVWATLLAMALAIRASAPCLLRTVLGPDGAAKPSRYKYMFNLKGGCYRIWLYTAALGGKVYFSQGVLKAYLL